MSWDATQYLKFERERTQPSIDLVNRVLLSSPQRILDLGCGPGNSTEVLFERYPGAAILGVDNSLEMIDKAKKDYPNMEFRLFDVNSPVAELGMKFDLIFSNACIQWVPDHHRLISDLMSGLLPGGVLAIQVPLQNRAPVHRMLGELSRRSEWNEYFGGTRQLYVLEAGEYYDLFSGLTDGFSLWTTVYYHRMASHAAIIEWYRGTGLRPYLQALAEEKRELFTAALLREIQAHYPVQADGSVLFPFERLFMTATLK